MVDIVLASERPASHLEWDEALFIELTEKAWEHSKKGIRPMDGTLNTEFLDDLTDELRNEFAMLSEEEQAVVKASYATVAKMRRGVVKAIMEMNPANGSGTSNDYFMILVGLVAGVNDFICCAPDERQAQVHAETIQLLRKSFAAHLASGR